MDETTIPGLSIAASQSMDLAKLALNKTQVSALKDEKNLEKATSGFESLLLNEMLKSMWDSVETSGLLGENSNEAQIYRDMFNQAIADNTAKGRGMGIKSYLRNEILRTEKNKIK